MNQVTKRQHYVWQKYLSKWTQSNQIWTYFIGENKIIETSLGNVAQKRYFYELRKFTKCDIKSIMDLINGFASPEIITISRKILEICSSIKKGKLVDKSMNNDDKDKTVKKTRRQIIENYHGDIENKGVPILEIKTVGKFKEYIEVNNVNDMLLYVYTQYWRTEKTRKSFVDRQNAPSVLKKHWSIICIFLAQSCTWNTHIDTNTRYKFIYNDTKVEFLTSDQPAINLVSNIINEEDVKDLELYYPLSPETALIIHFDPSQQDRIKGVDADEDYVKYLNHKMIEDADFFIFSENKKQLEELSKR
jgi:hypothetical protein